MANTYSNLFKKAYKRAKERGKFKDISIAKITKDIETEDIELYDELFNCRIKKEFTKEAVFEAWDGVIIRLNLMLNNDIDLLKSLTEYIKHQEERAD